MPNKIEANFNFHRATEEFINSLTFKREGEKRIGETIFSEVNEHTKFVILGIEESIGPQANKGFDGSENAYTAFLKRFLNMQSNRFLQGDEISLIGSIRQNTKFQTEEKARLHIEELDEMVFQILTPYLSENIIPIIIGGGHNNAFPIIKAFSKKFESKVDVINLDPHADCRALEGRHSGNPFSYAKHGGFLNKYSVLGLHKAYNSEFILNYLDDNEFDYTFFDDYILDTNLFKKDIERTVSNLHRSDYVGIELDLDSIQFMPSSAFTPSGISLENARYYLKKMSQLNCCYLHLPEGAPKDENGEKIIGKALAYLVWDFINAQEQ